MNQIEQQHIDSLLNISICDMCNEQMKKNEIPINQLPWDYINLLIANKLKYLVVRCPKCGSQGMHLFK